jgi:hypothetical protein
MTSVSCSDVREKNPGNATGRSAYFVCNTFSSNSITPMDRNGCSGLRKLKSDSTADATGAACHEHCLSV